MVKKGYENLSEKNKIIFLAGVFDGEGSFGIWSKWKRQKYLACSVETTDKDMVTRFYEFFGGCMYLAKKDSLITKIPGDGVSTVRGLELV